MSETNPLPPRTFSRTIAGQERTFTLPDSYDKMELIEEYQRIAKAKLLESLEMAGAETAQKVVDLHAHDEDPPLDWPKFMLTPRGRLFGFKLSLAHAHGAEAQAIARQLELSEPEELELAVKLWKLTIGNKAKDPAQSTATYGDASGEAQQQPNMQTYGAGGAAGGAVPDPNAQTPETRQAA